MEKVVFLSSTMEGPPKRMENLAQWQEGNRLTEYAFFRYILTLRKHEEGGHSSLLSFLYLSFLPMTKDCF